MSVQQGQGARNCVLVPAYPSSLTELGVEHLSHLASVFPICRMGGAVNKHLGKCRIKSYSESAQRHQPSIHASYYMHLLSLRSSFKELALSMYLHTEMSRNYTCIQGLSAPVL